MMNAVWSRNAVLYEMNLRQATPEGTLAAAAERLGFLRDLGIDAVWLMPHYPIGEVGRKGSLGSYYSIRDYRAVDPELGTLADFDAFVRRAHALGMKVLIDWVANHTSRDARWLAECPADWYERDASGRPVVPNGWDDTAKLDYTNRAVWQGQIDAMRFWLAEHGVDGFRCDMAMLVPIEFWQEAARRLRAVKPDLFLLAEAEEDYLFDREPVPTWALRLMFTSNHDENSWSGSEFARLGPAVRVMTALTFLLPQSLPLVYTGQEFGYDHSFAFFDRDPLPACEPNETTEFYRRLIALRHDAPALASGERGGSFVEIRNNAEDCLLTFVRETPENRVVALLNVSPYEVHADFDTGIYAGGYADALTGERVQLCSHVDERMPGWSFRILTRPM